VIGLVIADSATSRRDAIVEALEKLAPQKGAKNAGHSQGRQRVA